MAVEARGGKQFPDGRALLDQLNGLNAWCKVTVLRLRNCGLAEGVGRALAETLRVNTMLTSRSTFATMAWERAEGGRWQRHCASTPALRRSSLATMSWERAQDRQSLGHCA